MKARGKVHTFGSNIDTDVIIPARYLNTADPAELARHCMEDIDPTFASTVSQGDIIAAGANFGCGSSREHAPVAIKASGVACVVAESFARIFYRNAINTGLAIVECPEAAAAARSGDILEIDFESGAVLNLTTGEHFHAHPFPPFISEIIARGGLLAGIAPKAGGQL